MVIKFSIDFYKISYRNQTVNEHFSHSTMSHSYDSFPCIKLKKEFNYKTSSLNKQSNHY